MKTSFILFFIVIIMSCQKESTQAIRQCHDRQAWDSLSFHDHLIGKWQLDKLLSCQVGNVPVKTKEVIHFKADNTFEYFVNNTLKKKANWELQISHYTNANDKYSMKYDTSNENYVNGGYYLCGDDLSINRIANEDCDYRYVRIK